MPKMAIDSRVYGANVRRQPSFGDNIAGYLNQADQVDVTGPMVGGRWFPCRAKVSGSMQNVFVSKNVIRPVASDAAEELVQEAVKQWLRFDKSNGKETVHPYDDYVGEFWSSIGEPYDGDDTHKPWSAAFISWCVKKAGGYSGFKYNALHAVYVNHAIRQKLDGGNGPFLGYKISDRKPAIGDIVCMGRGSFQVSYHHASSHANFSSHCDIVVGLRDDHVSTLGGNVSNTVKRKTFRINNSGFLRDEKRLYALMKNNR